MEVDSEIYGGWVWTARNWAMAIPDVPKMFDYKIVAEKFWYICWSSTMIAVPQLRTVRSHPCTLECGIRAVNRSRGLTVHHKKNSRNL